MSQKRKHAEDDVRSSSKRSKVGSKSARTHRKAKDHTKAANTSSTTALKSRIRDLKRLLGHADNDPDYKMSANVRIERERELEACEHELAEKATAARDTELRNKMIGKYHQVRFFERQRATRILKRLRRELSTLDDRSKKKELQRKIHNAEVDLNYAMYYPLMKHYSSLYPKAKRETSKSEEAAAEGEPLPAHEDEPAQGPKGDLEMWRTVEKAMEEGTLEALRNSKPTAAANPEPKTDNHSKKETKKKTNKSLQSGVMRQMVKETKAAAQDEDEDSDGGFFE